jgi:hypothetical protein
MAQKCNSQPPVLQVVFLVSSSRGGLFGRPALERVSGRFFICDLRHFITTNSTPLPAWNHKKPQKLSERKPPDPRQPKKIAAGIVAGGES